jgi:hypothetical protein
MSALKKATTKRRGGLHGEAIRLVRNTVVMSARACLVRPWRKQSRHRHVEAIRLDPDNSVAYRIRGYVDLAPILPRQPRFVACY